MDKEQILKIIDQGENQQTEFKETVSASKDLAKDICAFANTKGGTVIIGKRFKPISKRRFDCGRRKRT